MLIQDFLLTHSLNDLEAAGIDYNLYDDGHILQLNYNMLTAKESDPMACECRALILSCDVSNPSAIVGETKVVSRAFDRFFNLDQQGSTVDFSKPTTIFEKLDGSLISLYHYKGRWNVATRSNWNGSNEFNGHTFRGLFNRALNEMGWEFDDFVAQLDTERAYLMELQTPLNQVVVPHDTFKLNLIGCRNRNGQEYDIRTIDIGIPIPAIFDFHSMADIRAFIDKLPDHSFEGFVVLDNNFHRVKIKSPKYLIAHKVATKAMTDINLLESILLEVDDDIIGFMPKFFAERLRVLKDALAAYVLRSDAVFSEHKHLDRKSFALAIVNSGLNTGYLFLMHSGKAGSTIGAIRTSKKNGEFPRGIMEGLLKVIL